MLANIQLFLTAEGTKYITALQKAETLCQMVWATLSLLHYIGKCILEEELVRRNQILKQTLFVLTAEAA